MKKILSFILVLTMILSFAACGKQEEQKPDEKIDMSKVTDVKGLKGSTIAVQTDLHEDLAKQIEDVKYTFYDNFDMAATAVKSGAVMGAIMDEPAAISYCQKDPSFGYVALKNNGNGFTVAEADYANAAAFKKGSALKDEVDAIIGTKSMDDYYKLMEEILTVSAGGKVEKFSIASDKTAEDKGVLKVGMECASEPFNWTDVDGASSGSVIIAGGAGIGEPCNGLDVQVAKYVAAELGYKLEVHALDWDSLLPAVDSGAIDCVIGNMSPREDRKVNYDFTRSYYDVKYVVLYKK